MQNSSGQSPPFLVPRFFQDWPLIGGTKLFGGIKNLQKSPSPHQLAGDWTVILQQIRNSGRSKISLFQSNYLGLVLDSISFFHCQHAKFFISQNVDLCKVCTTLFCHSSLKVPCLACQLTSLLCFTFCAHWHNLLLLKEDRLIHGGKAIGIPFLIAR